MSSRPLLAAFLGCCLAPIAFATGPASPFAGRWITESGNLEIDIAPCGDAWCGTVTRELGTRSMSGQGQPMTPVDTRPAVGMKILSALRPSSDSTTMSGDIYNRENAKTYSVRLSVDMSRQLRVRAYVLLPLFGKTQVWQRAPESAPSTRPPVAPQPMASAPAP